MSSRSILRDQIASKLHRISSRAASASSSSSSVEVDDVVFDSLREISHIMASKNQAAIVPDEVIVCLMLINNIMAKYILGNITITSSLMSLKNIANALRKADDTNVPEIDSSRAEFSGVKIRNKIMGLISAGLGAIVTGGHIMIYHMATNRLNAMVTIHTNLYNAMMTPGGGVGAFVVGSKYGIDLTKYMFNVSSSVINSIKGDNSWLYKGELLKSVVGQLRDLTPVALYNNMTETNMALDILKTSKEIAIHGMHILDQRSSTGSINIASPNELIQGWDQILNMDRPDRGIKPLSMNPATGIYTGQTDIFQRMILFSEDINKICSNSVACSAAAAGGNYIVNAVDLLGTTTDSMSSYLPSIVTSSLGNVFSVLSNMIPVSRIPSREQVIISSAQTVGELARITGLEHTFSNAYTDALSTTRLRDVELANFFSSFSNAMKQLGMFTEDLITLESYSTSIIIIYLTIFVLFIAFMFAPKYEDEEDTTFEHVKQGTVNLFRDAKNGMFDAFQDAFDLNPDIPLTASSAALSDPDDQYEDEDDDDLY